MMACQRIISSLYVAYHVWRISGVAACQPLALMYHLNMKEAYRMA